jgi:hypothetical protein
MPSIVEQKCRDYVKRRVVFLLSRQSAWANRLHPSRVAYLEETVYNLPPHILLVHDVQLTFQQTEDAFRQTIVGL